MTLAITRWKAAAIHLTISVTTVGIVLTAMTLLWYPQPYFLAMGGLTLILLLAGCDAVMGPLLTLIVFKTDKKQLRLDLAVIVLLQLAALAYGCSVMFAARPAYAVFVIDRFEVVAANDVIVTPGATALDPAFSTAPLNGPRIIGALMPTDWAERSALMMSAISGGADAKNLARLYVPYEQVAASAARKAKPLSVLAKMPAIDAASLRAIEDEISSKSDVAFLPLKARNGSLTVIVERPSGRVVDVLPIDPWQ